MFEVPQRLAHCRRVPDCGAGAWLQADLWMMSPPCQPFTCIGLQRDAADPRSNSLLHLVKLLSDELARPPRALFVENVRPSLRAASNRLITAVPPRPAP